MIYEYKHMVELGVENEHHSVFGEFMRCHSVYFIPVVNLDGFHEI